MTTFRISIKKTYVLGGEDEEILLEEFVNMRDAEAWAQALCKFHTNIPTRWTVESVRIHCEGDPEQ